MRALLLLTALSGPALAQDDLVAALLDVEAPVRDYEADPLVALFGVVQRPPDDAPLDEILDYWERKGFDPSPALMQRLVEACRAEPRLLPSVVRLLPDTAEIRAFVKAWFESPDARTCPGRVSDVFRWLEEDPFEHPRYLEDGASTNLARAYAFARSIADDEDSSVAVYGLAFLAGYRLPCDEQRHAVERLCAIAADTETDSDTRDWAVCAVARHGWEDAWLLPLFADEQVALDVFPETAPDRVVPVAAKVVVAEPGAARDRAADCLLSCGARADALRPLLPWLDDPAWANGDRDVLIYQLTRVDLPECVPGLLRMLENETDREILDAVFTALARYRVQKAAPLLRARYDAGETGPELFDAAVRCGAIPRKEMVDAVREYAGNPDGDGSSWTLGWYLADEPPEDDAVAAALLEGATPALAEIVHGWPGPSSAKDLVRRIGDGTASPKSVQHALRRREELGKLEGDGLRRILREGRGGPRGVAAALLGAPDPLDGDDKDAQRTLLACARILHLALPAEKVVRLLPDPAAEAYVAALDTPEMRACLDARMEDDPRPAFFSNDPLLREVYALQASGEGELLEVRVLVYDDRALLRWSDDPARWHARVLAKGEAEALANFIAKNRVDDLPQIPHLADDGTKYTYLHLTPARGRRIVIDNPDCADDADVYPILVRRFERLTERAPSATRYEVEGAIQGVELLARGGVEDTWAKGDDVRVCLGDGWRTLAGAEAPEPPQDTDLRPSGIGDGVLNGDRVLCCDDERLWVVEADGAETTLHTGRCGFGALSPDRRWFLIAITEGDWSVPNGLLCVDLATLAVREVDLPRAETNMPIAWLPAHRAFLVQREGDNAKSVLYDPATGAATEVKGQAGPILWMGVRGLQSTGRPDEYWAAISDEQGTAVGRYDARALAFTPVRRFPRIGFGSDAMWVDGGRAYVTYWGDLLRLPLLESEGASGTGPTPGR